MSSLRARAFLRGPRRGDAVSIGLEGGRSVAPAVSGLGDGSPEETVAAGSIVDRAQRRADELVRAAALAAASIEQDAYAEGLTAGHRQGTIDARVELLEALTLVQRVCAEAKSIRDALCADAEPEMVEMVIEACAIILGSVGAVDAEIVHETVRRALLRAGSQNVLRVRVAPEEHGVVAVRLAEERGEPLPFQVIADGVVRAGGCLIDTQAGRVDARLDVQFAAVAEMLRAALPVRPDDGLSDVA